jgi:hypothetical protein
MRPPFTDGFNSLWHFFFGAVTVYNPYVGLLFIGYQLGDGGDNMWVDLAEFAAGFTFFFSLR